MPTAVITGCNSGIGHEFAKVLLKEGYFVYAVDVNAGENLFSLAGPKCQVGRLDVGSIESIQEFKLSFGDTKLDVLLNVAGVMPNKGSDTLNGLTLDMVNTAFSINTFGPFFLTQALLPNILAGSGPRHIAVVSSRVGSIADNTTGGLYAYRASKTAVNSFFKNMSVELKDKNVVVSMLHPGYTKTGLDPDVWSMQEAIGPDEAAEKLWRVVKSKGIEETGRFWHREGNELPWCSSTPVL